MRNSNVVVASAYGPLIVNIHDRYITGEILKDGYWQIDHVRLIVDLLRYKLSRQSSVLFYDVGANIGTYALLAAKLQPELVNVRAFEAQRQIFHMLCGNMALNGIRNVACYNNAVSDVSGQIIEFASPDYDRPNNFGGLELVAPKTSDNGDMAKAGTDVVSTVSIDSFDEPVDLIKMDVEGMEDRALTGARETIRRHRPMCSVETLKTDAGFVTAFFKDQNYKGFTLLDDLIAIPAELDVEVKGLSSLF